MRPIVAGAYRMFVYKKTNRKNKKTQKTVTDTLNNQEATPSSLNHLKNMHKKPAERQV